jgi:hypothetical protein
MMCNLFPSIILQKCCLQHLKKAIKKTLKNGCRKNLDKLWITWDRESDFFFKKAFISIFQVDRIQLLFCS